MTTSDILSHYMTTAHNFFFVENWTFFMKTIKDGCSLAVNRVFDQYSGLDHSRVIFKHVYITEKSTTTIHFLLLDLF